jgi:hypothetical protein
VVARQRQGVTGEHRGSSGEAPGIFAGNEAHRKGVVGDSVADRWRHSYDRELSRGSAAGSSHRGQQWLGVLL